MRLLALTFLVLFSFIDSGIAQTKSTNTIIRNISVIDPQNNSVQDGYDVFIENDSITDIKPTSDNYTSKEVNVIDGTCKFLMPGLIDSHVHLREPNLGLPVYIGFGITTIRVMEGSENILNLKKEVTQKNLMAPSIITTTPYIEDLIEPDSNIQGLISSLKSEGYDLIKIHDDLPPNQYQKLIKVVREADMKLVGHAQRDKPIDFTLVNGQHEISHGEEFIYTFFNDQVQDTHRIDDLVRKVAATKTTVVPNIVFFKGMYRQATDQYYQMISDPDLIYVSAERRNAWITDSHRFYIDQNELPWYKSAVQLLEKLTLELHNAGVTILAGSDTPLEFMIPGKSLLQELYNFVDLGLSPAEALQTATVDAAEFMGRDELGKIDIGYKADFLVLDKNPLEDIRNIELLEGVLLRGRWYPKNILNKKLNDISNTYHKEEILLNARQTAMRQFRSDLDKGNVDSVINLFKHIDKKTSYSLLSESALNNLGYNLLSEERTKEAIRIFKLNTQLYPQSANVWDSLGESYWQNGEISKAIESYEKALQLNPKFENAKRALEKLRNK